MDDKVALEDIRNGGEKGYIVLHNRYVKSLRYYVMVTHHVPEESVDDVLQEVFFKFYKSLLTFQGKCSIKNWLYIITESMAKEYWRKVKKYDYPKEKTNEKPNHSDDKEELKTHNPRTISLSQHQDETDDDNLSEESVIDSLLYESLYQEQSQIAHNELALQIDLEHLLAQLKRESSDYLLNCLNTLTLLSQKQSIEDIATQIGRTGVATRQYISKCKKKLRQHPLFRQLFEELDNF